MALDIAALMTGSGGAFLGFVGAAFTREAKFNSRVQKRLDELETEVKECRARDGQMLVLSLGVQMIIPELQRYDRSNVVLAQVANAFKALPQQDASLEELMAKLDLIPGTKEDGKQAL